MQRDLMQERIRQIRQQQEIAEEAEARNKDIHERQRQYDNERKEAEYIHGKMLDFQFSDPSQWGKGFDDLAQEYADKGDERRSSFFATAAKSDQNTKEGVINQALERGYQVWKFERPGTSASRPASGLLGEALHFFPGDSPEDRRKRLEYVTMRSAGSSKTPEQVAAESEARVAGAAAGQAKARGIEGSDAYVEEQEKRIEAAEAEAKADRAASTDAMKAQRVIDDMDLAIDMIARDPLLTTKAIGLLSDLLKVGPGTDVAATLKSIGGYFSLRELTEMRTTSDTGASGLGQVTEREHALLQAIWGSVEQSQSADLLIRNLSRAKDMVRFIVFDDRSGDLRYEEIQQAVQSRKPKNSPISMEDWMALTPEEQIEFRKEALSGSD